MIFSEKWHTYAQEASLARSALTSGMESLAKADYYNPGSYYSAFFQLSTGIERLMKLIVMLEHKSKNNLKPLTNNELKSFSHDLVLLYEKCKDISKSNEYIEPELKLSFPDSLEYTILEFLSAFAKKARYYNLDSLTGSTGATNPIHEWFKIQLKVANHYISYQKKEKINQEALLTCDQLGFVGYQRSMDGEYRFAADDIYLGNLFKESNGYCVWSFLKLISPFYYLLTNLCRGIQKIETSQRKKEPSTPYFNEFFPFLLCNIATARRRKSWIRGY